MKRTVDILNRDFPADGVNNAIGGLGSTVEVILSKPKSEGNITEATDSTLVDPLVSRCVIEGLQSKSSPSETSGGVGDDCGSMSSLGNFLSDEGTIEGIKYADADEEDGDDERSPRGARGLSRWSNSTHSVLSSLKSMKDGLLPREADKVNTLTSEISDN